MKAARAVLISDIHYNINTLELAEASMWQAIRKAKALNVPLIVAGDLHDTKALMRGECVNAMVKTFVDAERMGVEIVILVGNHDKTSEKGEENSLNFLAPYASVIAAPLQYLGFFFIPYQATVEAFETALKDVPPGATLIMHQGVSGSAAGEYAYDHSAVDKAILAPYRTISGHYHRAQDIKCGRPQKGAVGLMSYIGTPYTVTFAEANDGPKGFQVLYDDGLMEQVETGLRKHIIEERSVDELFYPVLDKRPGPALPPGDLLWLKVTGPALELEQVTRGKIAKHLGIGLGFKLDLIPTDEPKLEVAEVETQTNAELMDALVEGSNESDGNKLTLKALWRKVMG